MKNKNTYENTEIMESGVEEHLTSLHSRCVRTNQYVWDRMKILDEAEMYGFHFEAKVGKEKILVVLHHEERVALNKAQKILKNVEKNGDVLFLTKLKKKKAASNRRLTLFIAILLLVIVTFVMSFLYKMGYLNFLLDDLSFTKSVEESHLKIENDTKEEPIVEEIVVDIEKLELLKEGFDEQNSSALSPNVLKALTLTTGIISEVVSEEEKAKYSAQALVENFKGKNGFKLVVKDDGSNKDFNKSVKALNLYAMSFVKENNLSEALNYYDEVSKEANLSKKEAMINAHYKGEIFERMGLNEEAKSSYQEALVLSEIFEGRNQTVDVLASLEGFSLKEVFKEQNQTVAMLNELVNLTHLAKLHEDLNETKRAEWTIKKVQMLYDLLIIELKKYGEVKAEELALALNYLANFYTDSHQHFLAIEIKKEALKIYDKLLKKSYKKYALIYYKSLNSLGETQLKVGEIKAAKQNYEEALNVMKRVVKRKVIKSRVYFARSYRALAMVAIKEQKFKEAKQYYLNALKIYDALKEKKERYSVEITDIHGEFATLYTLEKKFELAKKEYQEGTYKFIQMNKKAPLKYHLKIAKLLNRSAVMKVSNYGINTKEVIAAKLELRASIKWAKRSIEIDFKEAKESMMESYGYLAYIAGHNQKMTMALEYYKIYSALKRIKGIKAFNLL